MITMIHVAHNVILCPEKTMKEWEDIWNATTGKKLVRFDAVLGAVRGNSKTSTNIGNIDFISTAKLCSMSRPRRFKEVRFGSKQQKRHF